MKIDEFLSVMKKVARFKIKLERENIIGMQQQIILKVYIQELTSRVNTSMLGVI